MFTVCQLWFSTPKRTTPKRTSGWFLIYIFYWMTVKTIYIRDERLDILETFKEQHTSLLEVIRDSLVLAAAEIGRASCRERV